MYVYLLKNGRNQQIIDACDLEDNAGTLKANLLKTGEYDNIIIEEIEVNQDYIEPLAVVRVRGEMKPTGPQFSIAAYNPQGTMEDTIYFNMSGNMVTFNGYINLTAGEKAMNDVEALKDRIGRLVQETMKERLLNDNPL